jgi:hypothetical protein
MMQRFLCSEKYWGFGNMYTPVHICPPTSPRHSPTPPSSDSWPVYLLRLCVSVASCMSCAESDPRGVVFCRASRCSTSSSTSTISSSKSSVYPALYPALFCRVRFLLALLTLCARERAFCSTLCPSRLLCVHHHRFHPALFQHFRDPPGNCGPIQTSSYATKWSTQSHLHTIT